MPRPADAPSGGCPENQAWVNPEAVTQEAVTQEAVTQEAVTQEAVTQEAVTPEAVNQEAMPGGRWSSASAAMSPAESLPATLPATSGWRPLKPASKSCQCSTSGSPSFQHR